MAERTPATECQVPTATLRRQGDLWLVPTELERTKLHQSWQLHHYSFESPDFQLCGFGVIAAGMVAAKLILEQQPSRVFLVGIGGSYDLDRCPLGSVARVAHVYSDAVGAEQDVTEHGRNAPWGSLSTWQLPHEMGFSQLPAAMLAGKSGSEPLSSSLAADQSLSFADGNDGVSMLTVGIASGTLETAERRRLRFPNVMVEDMEGYAVAIACHMLGVPLTILRGITNQVGNRDSKSWMIDEAIESLVTAIAAIRVREIVT